MYITLPNIRHINYEDDIAVENYIKPIFTTAIKYLLNDYYEEMQLDDDNYIFSGCVIAENKTKTHSSIASHLHLLANIRDFVIDKTVIADRVICTLLNAKPDHQVEYYVPARHKFLETDELRQCFWTDEYRDKQLLFPDRGTDDGDPVLNYSIF